MELLPIAAKRTARFFLTLAALGMTISLLEPFAAAQDQPADSKPAEAKSAPQIEETFYIHNATSTRDLSDVQSALRNMLPHAALYAVQSQNAIAVRATPDDMAVAKRMLTELDRPHKAYRVTYTITDIDNGKPAGSHRIALVVVEGRGATLRQGDRVPLVTGMQKGPTSDQNAQVQYVDVGLNLQSDIDGEHLHSKIEQSSVADQKSWVGAEDPVIRQTMVDGYSNLGLGGSTVLGTLDFPGTSRQQKIEVVAEPLS
jgi:type II secretory pathway component GspD/PulD (secretin)